MAEKNVTTVLTRYIDCSIGERSVRHASARRIYHRIYGRICFALPQCGSPDPVDDDQEENGSNKGNEQTRSAEVALIDGRDANQRAHQPSGKGRANDSHNDVEHETLARSRNRACCPTNQAADDEPEDDIHHMSPFECLPAIDSTRLERMLLFAGVRMK